MPWIMGLGASVLSRGIRNSRKTSESVSGVFLECYGRILAERIFRGFLFLGRRIFSRILSSDFSSSFLWEKVSRKIVQENPW